MSRSGVEMGMVVNASLGLEGIRARYGAAFALGGSLQMFIDATVLKGVEPYVPMRVGSLTRSGILHTRIGQGMITWKTPYARYLYYGELMVDPVYGKGAFTDGERFWSRKGVLKVKSGRELKYDKSRHPLAQMRWAEAYKNDHLKELTGMVRRKARRISEGI